MRFGVTGGWGWCEWRERTMEGWRVSEEWGQAPEVQSHQLRQLCGANTGVKRWGLRMSLQRREREQDRDVVTALLLLILDD